MNRLSNKILIFVVCIAAVFFAAVLFFYDAAAGKGQIVCIYKDGELVRTIDLSTLTEPCTVELGSNTLRADRDGICMVHADCPDGLCMKQGRVSGVGRSIVCLPNRVTAEIKGRGEDADAVSGAR